MTIRRISRKTFRTITKNSFAFNEYVLKPLAKSFLIPLILTAAALATDAAIHKKMFRSGRLSDFALCMTTLKISNEEMNDIMKIVKSLQETGLLIKG